MCIITFSLKITSIATMPTLAVNKRAHYDYEILETFEAGIVLSGQETKSARAGHIQLKGSYVTIGINGASLINAHISKYPPAGPLPAYEPRQTRKLLLHKRELASLIGSKQQKGLTLVPLSMYTKHNRIKISFGIGRGKKQFDKRASIKEREWKRQRRQINA